MRHRLSAALIVLLCGTLGLTTTSAVADPPGADERPIAGGVGPDAAAAKQALEHARGVLARSQGEGAAPNNGRQGNDPTLALRDLFLAREALSGDDRVAAEAMLDRPTDGAQDQYGDGYTVPARRLCGTHVCIHWVPTTEDAPPSMTWVRRNLKVMENVWRFEVGTLGYRRPISDGGRGGNTKFDVYLANVGSKGYYGYCAAESYAPNDRDLASGYCVLDNNFSRAEFGRRPIDSMRVTAAHEFFHAIQYAYDLGEDRWLYEATATWMEERFADGVNDNRQYLRAGQLRSPGIPLDKFGGDTLAQYGNWIFFEFLSSRYGAKIVREIWNQAGAFDGAKNRYSVKAVSVVAGFHHAQFRKLYNSFAAANTIPGRSYPEGGSYGAAPSKATYTMSRSNRSTGKRWAKLPHLSARTVTFKPASGLTSRAWRLQISVNGPDAYRGTAAMAIVHLRSGAVKKYRVKIDGNGWGRVRTGISASDVRKVTMTVSNGSTRYRCWTGGNWACRGKSRDDGRSFMVSASILKP